MSAGESRWISDLLDLSGMGLDRINDIPESRLLGSLRRILRESGALKEQYAAFDNFVDPTMGMATVGLSVAHVDLSGDRRGADDALGASTCPEES